MNTRQRLCLAAVFAVTLTFVGPTLGGTVIVPTIDRGKIRDNGGHNATNDNYLTGASEFSDFMSSFTVERRSFFIFDLSAIPQEATSAIFRVYNPLTGHDSPDPFETLELNPIEKTPLTLFFSSLSGSSGTSAFADLGSHTVAPFESYATKDIQSTDVDAFIDIPLNAQALFTINQTINFSPSGYFGFGGKLTTIGVSIPGDKERVFANSGSFIGPGDGDTVLILSGPKIPEPCTPDLNGDTYVDSLDLGILLGNFNTVATCEGGELNETDPVDSLDLGILLGAWNPPAVSAASVPEPTTAALALAALCLSMSRRRIAAR